jgi:hypothetical protein
VGCCMQQGLWLCTQSARQEQHVRTPAAAVAVSASSSTAQQAPVSPCHCRGTLIVPQLAQRQAVEHDATASVQACQRPETNPVRQAGQGCWSGSRQAVQPTCSRNRTVPRSTADASAASVAAPWGPASPRKASPASAHARQLLARFGSPIFQTRCHRSYSCVTALPMSHSRSPEKNTNENGNRIS